LPVFFIIPGITLMFLSDNNSLVFNLKTEMIFLAVSIFGQLIRVLAAGYAPGKTSGRNTSEGQVADQLNVTGIYSVMRHPLYAGNFFMWLGPALFIRSVWFIIVFILAFWLYYERIMFAEEQFLRRKFGNEYDKWSEKVKAVIPSFRNYIPPELPFSFRTVLRREYNSFINIFVIFSILDILRNYILSGTITITPVWAWLLIGAIIFWIIIRMIHKNTKWLTVEGR